MSSKDYPYWKRVWQITSGNLKNVTVQEVYNALIERKEELLKGILIYKKLEKDIPITDTRAKDISEFIRRTAEYLNVSKVTAWDILKSYIVNEYCGSTKSIQKMIYEMQILPMLDNCWRYYTSERMFLIKTLKNIIEFMDNKEHPFCDIYSGIMRQLNYELVWNSLMEEINYLTNEIGSEAEKMPEYVQKIWVQRNMREIVEIIHCLILCSKHIKLQLSHFHKFLLLCKTHDFGNEPLYQSSFDVVDRHLLNRVRYSEVALLLCIINQIWINKERYVHERSLFEEIVPLGYRQEHGAVTFMWITLQLAVKNCKFDENYFHKLAQRSVVLDCFKFFHDMIINEMFQDVVKQKWGKYLAGTYVQIALYNMFAISFKNFDLCVRYFYFIDVAEVIEVLLKDQFICEECFSDNLFSPLWLTAVERFPMEKQVLVKLAEAIISSDCSIVDEIIEQLFCLPWYAELYNPLIVKHTQKHTHLDMFTVKILEDRKISNLDYFVTIPAHSEAVIKKEFGKIFIHYKKEVNFWKMFEAEVNTMLTDTEYDRRYDYLNLGFRLLLAILKCRPNEWQKHTILTEIVSLVFTVLEKYSVYSDTYKPMEILITCIDICTVLLNTCRTYVCSQMENFHLLPTLAKTEFTYEEIFHINFLDPGKLGNLIVRNERGQHHDLFLVSYLNFLRTSFVLRSGTFVDGELAGLVFILKEIFPHFMIWYAKRNRAYLDVLYQVIHFIFEMFQFSDEKDLRTYNRMRKLVFESFLNETCARCLLRCLSVGNVGVQNIMEGQTNWQAGCGIKYISVLQRVMSILIQLLTQKKNVVGDHGLTPLEHMIYTENEGVQSIQAIASFLNHSFNEYIPTLACRLLKKCTVELQMSMLAVLNLEPDQIRMMFVQRLRDHSESDEMKWAILELITVSIPKQPGMTEAFFKVSSNGSRAEVNFLSNFNEGIGACLVEILYKFSITNAAINFQLLYRIMNLFNVLWMHQKEILISDITADEHFWPSLCFPLFAELCISDRTYSEIFNIIGKEIHKKNGQVDEHLMKVLTKFFSVSEPYINLWLNHVIIVQNLDDRNIRLDEELPPADSLMVSFKDFIIICVTFLPPTFFTQEIQIKLCQDCRVALKQHVLNLNDICLVTFLAELYLFLMKKWAEQCFKNDIECYGDIVCIAQKLSTLYHRLIDRFWESFLTTIVLALRGLKPVAISHYLLTRKLMESVGIIFNYEYENFCGKYNNKQLDGPVLKYSGQKTIIMCFEAINELILIQNVTLHNGSLQWFGETRLLFKLIDCIRKFVDNKSTIGLSNIAIYCLINYAQSAHSNDFVSSDIDVYLWEKLKPPARFRDPKYLERIHAENLPWEIKEWWLLYKRVIMLLDLLLKKHGHNIFRKVLMFVCLHEEYFCEILLLERYTVETTALDLTRITLMFLYEMLKYKTTWKLDHEESLFNVLDAIKMSLNYSSAVLVRPSVLKYYTINLLGLIEETFIPECIPSELLVDVMSKLTDIVTLCASCILEVTPPIYPLLRDDRDFSGWPLQVGSNFGIPKFGDNESCELTFGLLFCVTSVYVRILHQVALSKKSTQATSPREILVARKSRSSKTEETDEKSPNADKESHFCFSQLKRQASKPPKRLSSGFIKIDYLNPTYVISAVENFGTFTSLMKTFPWYAKMSEEKVIYALETVVTLIAAQVAHLIYRRSEIHKDSKIIKRELASELQNFHEYVKRRLIETHRYIYSDHNLYRKKLGVVANEEPNRTSPDANFAGRVPCKRTRDRTTTELTRNTRLPHKTRATSIGSTTNLFEVKILPEDYIHFLSIWFSNYLHFEA